MKHKKNKPKVVDLHRDPDPSEPEVLGVDPSPNENVPPEALRESEKARHPARKTCKDDDPFSEEKIAP